MTRETSRPNPRRLCFVNYFGTVGGGQAHLLGLLQDMDRTRFEPEVVCCQDGPFPDRLRDLGFVVHRIPFGKGKRRYLHVSLPAMWKFHRLLRARRWDLVQVSGLQEAKLAAYPAAWAGVPMLWVVAP